MTFLLALLTVLPVQGDELPLVADGKIIALHAGPGVAADKAPALFLHELQQRVPAAKQVEGEEWVVRFDLTDRFDVGADGFELFIDGRTMHVVAQNDLSMFHAVGEILRRARWEGDTVTSALYLNPWLSKPICSLRAVWIDPTSGEYASWDTARMRQYLEELVLWGMDLLVLPVHTQWGRPAEGAAQWKRLAEVAALGKALGQRVCGVLAVNAVYPDRLKRLPVLRATPKPGETASSTPLACPTLTQGRVAIEQTDDDLLRQLPYLEDFLLTPFHDGGCWCDACRERGWADAYLSLARRFKESARKLHPDTRLLLSDEGFWDADDQQWQRLYDGLADKGEEWIDLFSTQRPDERTYESRLPGRFVMVEAAPANFAGQGAVPLLTTLPHQWRDHVDAGSNYLGCVSRTTGVHDHFNTLAVLRWLWSPRRKPPDLAGFITRYHFGEEAAKELIPLVLAMDQGLGATPFSRGDRTVIQARDEAIARRRQLAAVGERLPSRVREAPLFQSLLKRGTAEVDYWLAQE